MGRVVPPGEESDGVGAFGRALLNVLTLGAYQHPQGADQYWGSIAHSLNPTTRDGAINLAGIIVGGKMKGEPTAAQYEYLKSIQGTSRGENPAESIHQPANYQDPSVQALMQHLGAPGGYHPNPVLSYEMNPLIDLFHQNMARPQGLGVHPDTLEPGPVPAPNPDRLPAVMRAIARNNINRRN